MTEQVLFAASALAALLVVAGAALKGWEGWLSFKRSELDVRRQPVEIEGGARDGIQRIEIADLKERIRKLEAIASGVDL